VDIAAALISLDLAATLALDVGADADALVDAARRGTLDTVQVGGLPYLRCSEVSVWLRFQAIDGDIR